MIGGHSRSSARGAGDGKAVPRSQSYRHRWRLDEQSADRSGIKPTSGDARRADFPLLGLVGPHKLFGERLNEQFRLKCLVEARALRPKGNVCKARRHEEASLEKLRRGRQSRINVGYSLSVHLRSAKQEFVQRLLRCQMGFEKRALPEPSQCVIDHWHWLGR